MTKPNSYSLPEQFIQDKSVPMRWKLYSIINGFWLGGLTAYASNHYFSEKLNCSERHIQGCLEDLENMGILVRRETPKGRILLPGGTNAGFVGGRTGSSKRDEPSVHPNSVSNSDNKKAAEAAGIVEVHEQPEGRRKSPPEFPHSKEVFSWFKSPQESWLINRTERAYAELLWKRGEKSVRQALAYVEAHKDDDRFYLITKPSHLETKWLDLVAHANRHD